MCTLTLLMLLPPVSRPPRGQCLQTIDPPSVPHKDVEQETSGSTVQGTSPEIFGLAREAESRLTVRIQPGRTVEMAQQAVRVAIAWRLGSAEQPVRADTRHRFLDWWLGERAPEAFLELAELRNASR